MCSFESQGELLGLTLDQQQSMWMKATSDVFHDAIAQAHTQTRPIAQYKAELRTTELCMCSSEHSYIQTDFIQALFSFLRTFTNMRNMPVFYTQSVNLWTVGNTYCTYCKGTEFWGFITECRCLKSCSYCWKSLGSLGCICPMCLACNNNRYK